MVDPAYTLVASRLMVPYIDEHQPLVPADKVACVVLPDGSFFVGVCFVPWNGSASSFMRVWRLDVNLAELGTTDIPLHVTNWSPVAYLTDGMTVVLHNAYNHYEQVESFIIDCGATTPVVTSSGILPGTNLGGDHLGFGNDDGVSSVRLGNGMTLIATGTGVEVWDGITHKGLWTVETYKFDPEGSLWPNPADPMTVAVMGWRDVTYDGRVGKDFWTEFTVSADGMTITPARKSTVPYASTVAYVANGHKWQDQRFAVASPYLGKTYALSEAEIDVGTYTYQNPYNHLWYTSTIPSLHEGFVDYMAPLPEVLIGDTPGSPPLPPTGGNTYTNVQGPMVRLGAGKFASQQEVGFFLQGTYSDVYSQRLIGADPEVGTVEVLALPYDPTLFPDGPYGSANWDNPVTLYAGSMGMASDPNTGRIVLGTTLVGSHGVDGVNVFCMQLWSVQGPGNMPNLNGNLLDDRVRFTP